MIRVGIVGITGYTGMELFRILMRHPACTLTYVAASEARELNPEDLFLDLDWNHSYSIEKFSAEECQSQVDVAFVALPSGAAGEVTSQLVERGVRVIDCSGDLRLTGDEYELWYNRPPVRDSLQKQAVYGLTEFYREEIASAFVVANPGCFATAALLGVLPLVRNGLVDSLRPLIFDGKSGTTGAGRSAKRELLFSELNENFYAYRVGTHQHIPEIANVLARKPDNLILTTQLMPVSRGIYMTSYVPLERSVTASEISLLYQNLYEGTTVHVLQPETMPQLKQVTNTNRAVLQCHVHSPDYMQVIVALDNLGKGAAGQAVQNMNVMMGRPDQEGLWIEKPEVRL